MNNTFLEYGKKGNSKELMEILSHIFNRNNELSELEKKRDSHLYLGYTWIG